MIYTTLMCDLPFEAPESESVFKVKKIYSLLLLCNK